MAQKSCLDEADEMLSRGFTEQIYDIFQLLPQATQVVLLSATMPQDVLDVTTEFIRDPVRILVKKDEFALEGIKQFYLAAKEEDTLARRTRPKDELRVRIWSSSESRSGRLAISP